MSRITIQEKIAKTILVICLIALVFCTYMFVNSYIELQRDRAARVEWRG